MSILKNKKTTKKRAAMYKTIKFSNNYEKKILKCVEEYGEENGLKFSTSIKEILRKHFREQGKDVD